VDANHLIFLEGAQWASKFDVFGPPFDSRWRTASQVLDRHDAAVIQEYLTSPQIQVPATWVIGRKQRRMDPEFRGDLGKERGQLVFLAYKKLDAMSCVASIESRRTSTKSSPTRKSRVIPS